MSSLSPRLVTALAELFGLEPGELVPEAELEADLALDSLAIVELQVVLEESFGVRIDAEGPAGVRTLGDLQDLLDRALSRGEPLAPRLDLSLTTPLPPPSALGGPAAAS